MFHEMHDFLLAKEIVDALLQIAAEKKLSVISKVSIGIGQIALAHDGFDEHIEDISIENLRFGLETVSKGTILEKAIFDIRKTKSSDWNLISIDGE